MDVGASCYKFFIRCLGSLMHGHRTGFGSREEPVTHKEESPSSPLASILYILALTSSNNAFNLSISVFCAGHSIPNPSAWFGFGIYRPRYTYQRPEPGDPCCSSCWNIPCENAPTTPKRDQRSCQNPSPPPKKRLCNGARRTYMIHLLMRQPPIVLQHVEILRVHCCGKSFDDRL